MHYKPTLQKCLKNKYPRGVRVLRLGASGVSDHVGKD